MPWNIDRPAETVGAVVGTLSALFGGLWWSISKTMRTVRERAEFVGKVGDLEEDLIELRRKLDDANKDVAEKHAENKDEFRTVRHKVANLEHGYAGLASRMDGMRDTLMDIKSSIGTITGMLMQQARDRDAG